MENQSEQSEWTIKVDWNEMTKRNWRETILDSDAEYGKQVRGFGRGIFLW